LTLLSVAFGTAVTADTRILDLQHQSRVFGETRNFRIFLPPSYETDSAKRYPVIYIFHGYGERHNRGPRDGERAYDSGDDYQGDNIAGFVENHDVIVVKWDGYNPRTPGEDYRRPYNIGPVETYRQFPAYFPELVEYIDANYRTIPDRNHRAVSGLSMGGFMAFWIGGKYPHLVGSVSNFMGSAEFWAGPKAFPSEYLHTSMYRNYEGVRTRIVMGARDFIRWYHRRMNQVWDFVRPNFEHETFDWDHGTPGMAKQLGFHMNAFTQPLPRPGLWHHIDVYPTFEVWGYSVATDRHRSGFTLLENVSTAGFRSAVREWLPDGQYLPSVRMDLVTDSLYRPNATYRIVDVDLRTQAVHASMQKADALGRLHFQLDGGPHEVGILDSPTPLLTLAGYTIEGSSWVTAGNPVEMTVRALNKGTARAVHVTATLETTNPEVAILAPQAQIESVVPGEIASATTRFRFQVNNPDQLMAGFSLRMNDAQGSWVVPFEVPVYPAGPELSGVEIADGRRVKVQVEGNKVEERLLGIGNGDGVANPGETFVVLVRDQEELRMTSLVGNDPCLNPGGLNLRFSDYWGNYDHVGGSAKVSMPVVTADCPADHELLLFAEYWLPQAPEHLVRRGPVRIKVSGTDLTAPKADSVQMAAGNLLEARIIDGGGVREVTARLVKADDPSFRIDVGLNDAGLNGDGAAGDAIFSAVVPDLPEGTYRVALEMTDYAGNQGTDSFDLGSPAAR